MTHASRTTSTEALQVITGILLIDLKAMETHIKFLIQTQLEDITIGGTVLKSNGFEIKLNIPSC